MSIVKMLISEMLRLTWSASWSASQLRITWSVSKSCVYSSKFRLHHQQRNILSCDQHALRSKDNSTGFKTLKLICYIYFYMHKVRAASQLQNRTAQAEKTGDCYCNLQCSYAFYMLIYSYRSPDIKFCQNQHRTLIAIQLRGKLNRNKKLIQKKFQTQCHLILHRGNSCFC